MPPPKQPGLTPDTELKYLVFQQFETMDTRLARIGMPATRLAWCENFQIVGPNNLVSVAAPGTPTATLSLTGGVGIYRLVEAVMRNDHYMIAYTTDGAGYQITLLTGNVVQFAPPGTFSDPDTTVYRSDRLLIADPTAGYCTWDTVAFVQSGGVSPNFTVNAGSGGYGAPPLVTISGGSGSGATAVATVIGGYLASIQLTNAGTGYLPTDTLTVTLSPVIGGASASATPWPQFNFAPNSICVYQGLVWITGASPGTSISNARILQWSGSVAGAYDNFNPVNASGSTLITDADLNEGITAIRSLNNFLYIFGNSSVKQIGSISVSGSNLFFTISTVASDQGTIWRDAIVSYNKLVLFANRSGVFAIFGSSLQKVSDMMDGIFSLTSFLPQKPQAAVTDLNERHTFLLLVVYNDPIQDAQRSLILAMTDKVWYVLNQGSNLTALAAAHPAGVFEAFGSDGTSLIPLFTNPAAPVPVRLSTSLSEDSYPQVQKMAVRAAISQSSIPLTSMMTWTQESEATSVSVSWQPGLPLVFTNGAGGQIFFTNAGGGVIVFTVSGYQFQPLQVSGTGIYLGGTITGMAQGMTINNMVIEYRPGVAMRSTNLTT